MLEGKIKGKMEEMNKISKNQIDSVLKSDSFRFEQETLNSVRGYIIAAQKQVYSAVNSAMVTAYWNIGKVIYEACGETDRAGYGKKLLQYLSEKLEAEFGKSFSERNLQMIRKFY